MSCNSSIKIKEDTANKANRAIVETEDTSKGTSIENVKWVISSLDGQKTSNMEQNGEIIYFTLNPNGNRINGNSGCNTFMGTYTLEEGNRISFSQLASTRKMCLDAKINEAQILDIFNAADNYSFTNGQLELNRAKMAPLATFKKIEMDENPVIEKYWKLKTLAGKTVTMAENQEREICFTLKNDGRVIGFAGCNTINGEYTLEEGNRIRFKNMATTMKACPDVNVDEQAVLEVFNTADNYTINDDVLNLNVGRRSPLAVFETVYMQ